MTVKRQKLYCYVDESGQDTRGRLFVVGVVVTGAERNQLREMCERIEEESGKGDWKWVRASRQRQVAYMRRMLDERVLRGKLYFAVYEPARDYLSLTIETVTRAVDASGVVDFRVVLLVDGLPAVAERAVGKQLRQLGIRTHKVRGVRDESDPLIRLADAVCGLVRAAQEGQPDMRALLAQGVQAGAMRDVSR